MTLQAHCISGAQAGLAALRQRLVRAVQRYKGAAARYTEVIQQVTRRMPSILLVPSIEPCLLLTDSLIFNWSGPDDGGHREKQTAGSL